MKTYVVKAELLNAVLNALAELPYAKSVGLIAEIMKLNEQHPPEVIAKEEDSAEPEVLEGEVVS